MLYIAEQSEEDASFGSTKLNKVLFYADFLSYATAGLSITGAEYQRLRNGPAPQQLLPVLEDIKLDGYGVVVTRDRGGYSQQRLIALRPAKIEAFSGPEIALVDRVIKAFWGRSAAQVSELSHREVGWRLSRDKQEIPYETAFLSSSSPTVEDLEWMREVVSAGGPLGAR
jgi:hypothetical protein